MNEQKIQEFIDYLFREKITKKYSHDSSTYTVHVVEEQGRTIVEQMLRNFLLENREEQLGTLQAKVFMYEQIISKSNFAPMISPEKLVKIPECKLCNDTGWQFIPNFGGGGTTQECHCVMKLRIPQLNPNPESDCH